MTKFDKRLFNVYATSSLCQTTRGYTTALPFQQGGGKNAPKYLPKSTYHGRENYFIRAMQWRHRSRESHVRQIVPADFKWEFQAGVQANQGGFMKTMTLAEMKKLREFNSAVAIFGTASVPGRLHVDHLRVLDELKNLTITPIIRSHGVKTDMYALTEAATERLAPMEGLVAARAPLSAAITADSKKARDRDQQTNAQRIEQLLRELQERSPEVAENLAAFGATLGNTVGDGRKLENWIKAEIVKFDAKIEALGADAVALQQAQRGYQELPPFTELAHSWELYESSLFIIGAFIKSLYHPKPVLGGNAARGCGALVRTVYSLSVSSGLEPPDFDVLLRIEPFKPLQLGITDIHSGDGDRNWEKFVGQIEWYKLNQLDTVPKLANGETRLIVQALQAWEQHPKDFDMNYVPGILDRSELSDRQADPEDDGES